MNMGEINTTTIFSCEFESNRIYFINLLNQMRLDKHDKNIVSILLNAKLKSYGPSSLGDFPAGRVLKISQAFNLGFMVLLVSDTPFIVEASESHHYCEEIPMQYTTVVYEPQLIKWDENDPLNTIRGIFIYKINANEPHELLGDDQFSPPQAPRL